MTQFNGSMANSLKFRRRFFVPRERIRDGVAFLPPDEIHHLRDVLRLKAGDEVEVFDGKGVGYRGKVETHGSEARIMLLEKLSADDQPHVWLTLAPALIKVNRFEWILQKATELGIDEIMPLTTRFSEIRIAGGKLESRMERWRRIVREASKQCCRLSIPQINAPVRFEELLSLELPPSTSKLLFYEKAATAMSRTPTFTNRVLICIGPEGGWDAGEVGEAARAGFQIFSLGPRILRAETAAIATLAIIQFIIGTHR
jgi:16S rRNA (uracil1498-N3)-methyltransferase